MASLEDENKAALASIMKRAKIEGRRLPKFIRDFDADIRAKKMIKDTEEKLDGTTTGKLINLAKNCEDVAKFLVKQKTYTELKVPSNNVIRAPNLTVATSVGDYVALAVVVRIFLLKLSKSSKPK